MSSLPVVGLDEHECLELLASVEYGRIGLSVGALPAIYPVTYRLHGDRILFLPPPDGPRPAALSDTVVAFQADHTDPSTAPGWHVHAVGIARLLDHHRDRRAAAEVGLLLPDAPDARPLVALHPARIDGWRLEVPR